MWLIPGHCVAWGREDLKNDKASNITIDLVGESLTHLIGTFIGPEDTPYHDGTYEVVSTGVSCDPSHQHRRDTLISPGSSLATMCATYCHPSTPGAPPSEGVYEPGFACASRNWAGNCRPAVRCGSVTGILFRRPSC